MCFVFLYLPQFSTIEYVSHGKAPRNALIIIFIINYHTGSHIPTSGRARLNHLSVWHRDCAYLACQHLPPGEHAELRPGESVDHRLSEGIQQRGPGLRRGQHHHQGRLCHCQDCAPLQNCRKTKVEIMVKEGMKALQNTGTLGVFFMDTYILCCLLFVFVKVSFTLGCSGGWWKARTEHPLFRTHSRQTHED